MVAYPPPVPPATRTDSTTSAVTHAADHNMDAAALAAIVGVLGAAPQGGYADLTARLIAELLGDPPDNALAADLAAAAAAAVSARNLAQQYRDQAAAIVVNGLATTDDQTAALIAATSSETRAALAQLLGTLVPSQTTAPDHTKTQGWVDTSTTPSVFKTWNGTAWVAASNAGTSNVGLDTDGVPYYAAGASGAVITADTDGVPYFEAA